MHARHLLAHALPLPPHPRTCPLQSSSPSSRSSRTWRPLGRWSSTMRLSRDFITSTSDKLSIAEGGELGTHAFQMGQQSSDIRHSPKEIRLTSPTYERPEACEVVYELNWILVQSWLCLCCARACGLDSPRNKGVGRPRFSVDKKFICGQSTGLKDEINIQNWVISRLGGSGLHTSQLSETGLKMWTNSLEVFLSNSFSLRWLFQSSAVCFWCILGGVLMQFSKSASRMKYLEAPHSCCTFLLNES